MVGKARRADGGVFAGMTTPLDTSFLKFVNHHGLQEVGKMFCHDDRTMDEKREAFRKMVSDFNSTPLKLDEDEDEDEGQDRDLEDEDEDEDEDLDEGEEDDDGADGKACKLFGDSKRASLEKRLHAPIEDVQELKKPRVEQGSCVQGDKTEAAGIKSFPR